jgi:hypothetical protein
MKNITIASSAPEERFKEADLPSKLIFLHARNICTVSLYP